MEGRYTKYRVLIGAFLINIPTCLSMLFGNVSTYVYSYFYCRSLPDANNIDPPTMHGIPLVFACVSALAVDRMRYRLGLRVTMAVAMVFCISAFLLTYFAVQRSAWATALTFMVVGGIGDGLVVPVTLVWVAGWFEPRSVGLAGCVASSASGVGAYAFNTLVTAYINPGNLSPDGIRGKISFFTQEAVVERVPMSFVILGAASAACQLVGFLLLKLPPSAVVVGDCSTPRGEITNRNKDYQGRWREHDESKGVAGNDVIREPCGRTESNLMDPSYLALDGNNYNGTTYGSNEHRRIKTSQYSSSDNGHRSIKHFEFSSFSSSLVDIPEATKLEVETSFPDRESVGISAVAFEKKEKKTKKKNLVIVDSITEEDGVLLQVEPSGKTPRQLLGSETFYLVWFSAFAEALGLLITATYFKMFGQLWISDDRLLAASGGVSSLLAVASRPACGYLIDRLGVKNVLIIHTASSSFLLALWYFTPRHSKWWFFVWTVAMFMFYFNQFPMYPIVCLKLFGLARFATNLFLVQTAVASVMLGLPPLLVFLLRDFGWYWMFFIGAATAFVSFVLLVVRMPSE